MFKKTWHAGYTWDGMIHKISSKQWEAMLAVHCTAPFRLIQVRQETMAVKIEPWVRSIQPSHMPSDCAT